MTTATENAPSLSGNSAEGETENLGEPINMKTTDTLSQAADIDLLDEGPTISDVIDFADVLGVGAGDLLVAITPLMLEQRAKRKRTLRRPAAVDERLRELDN